jgi:hypothetical protein
VRQICHMREPPPHWVNGAIAERRCRANPSKGDAKAILATGLRWSGRTLALGFGLTGANKRNLINGLE